MHNGFITIIFFIFISCKHNKVIINDSLVELPKVKWICELLLSKDTSLVFTLKNNTHDNIYYDDRFFYNEICCIDSFKVDRCKVYGKKYLDPFLIERKFEELKPHESRSFSFSIMQNSRSNYKINSEFHYFLKDSILLSNNEKQRINTSMFLKSYKIEIEAQGSFMNKRKINLKHYGIVIPPLVGV